MNNRLQLILSAVLALLLATGTACDRSEERTTIDQIEDRLASAGKDATEAAKLIKTVEADIAESKAEMEQLREERRHTLELADEMASRLSGLETEIANHETKRKQMGDRVADSLRMILSVMDREITFLQSQHELSSSDRQTLATLRANLNALAAQVEGAEFNQGNSDQWVEEALRLHASMEPFRSSVDAE
ncbi:MAG: hypothetical protein JJU36_16050 [Phycisphaeraceae bacterium]|nr:hypothetical protein [Phycisphaeraceae bacterium]